ncbi:MAG: GntR family transcriptional regulator [Rhizobiales bacterium]|nr:GntR family transcriptional regulator [Hyphomicrobiales bacterium]
MARSREPVTKAVAPEDAGQKKRGDQKRAHITDQVAKRLRHGLMTGAFIPGQVMGLRALATAFGTSSMPIRSGLSQLVAANVLEELPSGSVRVPRLSASKLKELFEVREVVENMAAKAALRNVDADLTKRLSAINKRLLAAIDQRDVLECLSINQEFHFTLYEAAKSDVLMPLIESLWLLSGPTMYFSFMVPNSPWDASEHKEIIDGLKAGDVAAVQRALSRDIRTTARHLLASSTSNGPLKSQIGIAVDRHFR